MANNVESLMRARMRQAIIKHGLQRGPRPTDRERLRNLWNALVEHDSDCRVHRGKPCSCGAVEFKERVQEPEPRSIQCPRCLRRSYHPKDIEHRYCVFCGFHEEFEP